MSVDIRGNTKLFLDRKSHTAQSQITQSKHKCSSTCVNSHLFMVAFSCPFQVVDSMFNNCTYLYGVIVAVQCINTPRLLFSLSLSLTQPRAPLYAYAQMTEEQRIQLVQRLTLIQCLPCGRYADSGKEEKKSLEVDLEESTTVGSGEHGEKKGDKGDKGDKDRE